MSGGKTNQQKKKSTRTQNKKSTRAIEKNQQEFFFFQSIQNLFKTHQNMFLNVFYVFLIFLKILRAVEGCQNVNS